MSKVIETNVFICSSCKYGRAMSSTSNGVTCTYYVKTGIRRGCPVGICDKYINKKKR